jgi:outer membrane protein
LQMKAQLAADKVAQVDAENQLQIAKVVLMQLIDLPISDDFETDHPATPVLVTDTSIAVEDIYRIAEGSLSEVKSAAIKTKALETGLKVSKAAGTPKLTLSGNLGSSYSSTNSLVTYQTVSQVEHIGYLASNPLEIVDGVVSENHANSSYYSYPKQISDNFGQGLSVNLSIPVFNNLLYKSDIRRSQVAVRIAKLNERLVKNQLRKSIELAYTDQRTAANSFLATREQLVAEEAAYRNVTVKFKAGLINTTDFFVEKSMYNRAQVAHTQAKYQYLYKTKILNFYLNNAIAD